jgi:hypothetical protein
MMSNIAKANKLREAFELIDRANAIMQEALGAGEESYKIHCACEDLEDMLKECYDNLIEMQITE